MVLNYATDEAMRTGHKVVRSDHFMLALLRKRDSLVCEALRKLHIDLDEFKTLLDRSLFVKDPVPYNDRDKIKPSKDAMASLHAAVYESLKTGNKETAPQHLILGLAQNTMCFTWIYLKEHKVGVFELKEAMKTKSPSSTRKLRQNKVLIQKLNSSLGEQLTKLYQEKTFSS